MLQQCERGWQGKTENAVVGGSVPAVQKHDQLNRAIRSLINPADFPTNGTLELQLNIAQLPPVRLYLLTQWSSKFLLDEKPARDAKPQTQFNTQSQAALTSLI